MSSRRYWKNRLPFLLTNLVCMAALTVFLLVCGNSVSAVVLILIVWALILLAGIVLTYWKRKRQMKKLLDMAKQLSERYLIPEVMELPEQAEDQVYYQLLKMAEKSMLEQIGEVERERLEYKEYIEQWIHEIKTPITAMKLLCENHRTDWAKELLLELEKTDRFTEQALYYARSEHTEKDYSVREIVLSQVVHQAIADNKYLLLQSGMRLEVEEMQDAVYSDEKWVRFILNQLIANAVKYRTEKPTLRISTRKRQDQIVLVVEDNGIGITASDLPRIFEKGFTGQNGRMVQQSTGIGLYLCKRLCEKLGTGITAESSEQGTAISLSFHINCLIHEVQS
ncbi:sensor histidine kinase [Parablautia sp. Marseille-Q6255]|uniref:sensor histidine kinase n=1 Tax=Parablautia sp. Marseille-Q6255 TaxID=3039593 RepID=UPI0024BD14BF|nr:sensor histidine kinase [Parablautia sp. Marseille-Q6255]